MRLIRFLRTSGISRCPATGEAVSGPRPQTRYIVFGNPTWHSALYTDSMETAMQYAVHVNLGTGPVCVEGILPSNLAQDARDTLC